jgi:hypothetical protein
LLILHRIKPDNTTITVGAAVGSYQGQLNKRGWSLNGIAVVWFL